MTVIAAVTGLYGR